MLNVCFLSEKEPTLVQVDIFVRSMSKISELDMEYSFECYFRQRWTDKRLAFNDTQAPDTLTISVKTIDKLWKPYTYIENARYSHVNDCCINIFIFHRLLYSSFKIRFIVCRVRTDFFE